MDSGRSVHLARLALQQQQQQQPPARSLQGFSSGSMGSEEGHGMAAPSSMSPRRAYGEMRIWVGTWNMGAEDPFLEMGAIKGPEQVRPAWRELLLGWWEESAGAHVALPAEAHRPASAGWAPSKSRDCPLMSAHRARDTRRSFRN